MLMLTALEAGIRKARQKIQVAGKLAKQIERQSADPRLQRFSRRIQEVVRYLSSTMRDTHQQILVRGNGHFESVNATVHTSDEKLPAVVGTNASESRQFYLNIYYNHFYSLLEEYQHLVNTTEGQIYHAQFTKHCTIVDGLVAEISERMDWD